MTFKNPINKIKIGEINSIKKGKLLPLQSVVSSVLVTKSSNKETNVATVAFQEKDGFGWGFLFSYKSNWPKKDIKIVVSMGKSKSCIVGKVYVLTVCLGWMSVAVKMIVNFALKTCFKKSYNLLGFLKPCLIFNQIHSQIKTNCKLGEPRENSAYMLRKCRVFKYCLHLSVLADV